MNDPVYFLTFRLPIFKNFIISSQPNSPKNKTHAYQLQRYITRIIYSIVSFFSLESWQPGPLSKSTMATQTQPKSKNRSTQIPNNLVTCAVGSRTNIFCDTHLSKIWAVHYKRPHHSWNFSCGSWPCHKIDYTMNNMISIILRIINHTYYSHYSLYINLTVGSTPPLLK